MSLSFRVRAMGHDLYMNILTGMFLFWNAARVLTYVPTIVRLVCAPTDARSHSLLTWLCWVLSNGTFALMLLERNDGVPEAMFWLNVGNTTMCLIVCAIIFCKQHSVDAR
ncbi:hypothetical protein CBA19CS11_12160 [Caballeronia novacaledonica]|uniref:hypothetical protein n=2 Tax=Caballeronia TaxID=1827195 RepID=UPI001EE23392|nr:hypothetical protein [Caballeronia novacaledonica]GJH09592.1 hypothetical protein CBA19CS11_12160 [Caballeronia novacaledonica]